MRRSRMHAKWRHSEKLFMKFLISTWCKNVFSSQSWFAVQCSSSYRIFCAIKTCTVFDQVVIDIQHFVETVGPKSEELTEFVGNSY